MSDFDTVFDAMFSDSASDSGSDTAETSAEPVEAASPEASETPVVEKSAEPAAQEEAEVVQPIEPSTLVDPAATEPPKPAAASPDATAQSEDLPEGASLEIDKKTGQEFLRYPKARAIGIYAGYKAANQLAQMVGRETLDEAAVNELAMDRSTLIDLETRMSEGADRQQAALEYLLAQGSDAYNKGIVAEDPHAHTANAFLAAAAKVAPNVVTQLESHFQGRAVEALYQKALAAGVTTETGKVLLGVAQRADQALSGSYRKVADVVAGAAPPDPNSAREKSLEERERRINEFDQRQAQQRWDAWGKTVTEERRAVATELVTSYLEPLRKHMSGLPKDVQTDNIKNLEIRLKAELSEGLKLDPTWGPRMKTLFERASNARSEEFRGQVRGQIKAQFAAKAREILSTKAPAIINRATEAMVANSKAQHERLNQSQGQARTTTSTGAAQPPTLPRQPNGKWKSSEQVARDLDSMFA